MRVFVPLANGFEEIEALTIIDILRRGLVEVTTASLTDEKCVVGAHGIPVIADTTMNELETQINSFGAVILPGGGEGTTNLMKDERLLSIIRKYAREEKFVCAICAAPMVLAKAEVLEGHRATCYPAVSCIEALGEAYDESPVIVDGNIITGSGPGSAMLFSFIVLSCLVGEPIARKVSEGMLTTF